jgi:hypothetical protein
MPAGMPTVTGQLPVRRNPNKSRARVRLDRRFAAGRRVKELVGVFRQRLGADADDPLLAANVERAAELVALSELLRAKALSGQAPADDVVRTTRLADQAVRRLQLERRVAKPAGPTLMDILREGQHG